MSTQHTPAPWAAKNGRHETNTFVVAPGGDLIASVVREHDARLIAAAPDMHAILDELEDSFDKAIYPEQAKEDFDAPDDREYTVTITAKQWRALGRAIAKAVQP